MGGILFEGQTAASGLRSRVVFFSTTAMGSTTGVSDRSASLCLLYHSGARHYRVAWFQLRYVCWWHTDVHHCEPCRPWAGPWRTGKMPIDDVRYWMSSITFLFWMTVKWSFFLFVLTQSHVKNSLLWQLITSNFTSLHQYVILVWFSTVISTGIFTLITYVDLALWHLGEFEKFVATLIIAMLKQ